jgi:cysteinyl-tRNA synthetase
VVFLTDGRPTVGTIDENQILASATKSKTGLTRIFCFGIGTDVNTHLLDKIAEETKAFSTYVLPEEDIEVKLQERNEARKRKDFAKADEIRKSLAAQGIIVEDKPDGTTRWKR